MTTLSPRPIQFGPFELDPIQRELRKGGLRVKMTPHQMSLLCLLLELPLRVQTREEIQRRLWPGNTFVDFEHGINKVVHSLRTTLGDSATNARYIETVNTAGYRTTGYRFIPHSLETSNDTEMRSQPRRVAVLPITTTRPEELLHHCRRITWRLIDALSAVGGVRVMADATLKSCNVDDVSPQKAGETLGVDAVISGELTRIDGALFLRIELIDVCDGSELCGAYAEAADLSGAHCDQELAEDVLKQLRPVLAPMAKGGDSVVNLGGDRRARVDRRQGVDRRQLAHQQGFNVAKESGAA
jgi:DNA-binding winged helix-turn-helix (wHTH) protein